MGYRRHFVCAILFCAVLGGSSAAAAAEPEPTKEPGRFRLELQQVPQVMRAGLGHDVGLLASYELFRHLHLDAGFRYGGIYPLSRRFELQSYLGGIAGLALTTGADQERWEVRLGGRYARVHHATWGSWARTPFANFVGAGGATGAHGAEVVLGATKTANQGFEFGDLLFSVSARAGYFPNSVEMNWVAGVVLAAGFRLYRK